MDYVAVPSRSWSKKHSSDGLSEPDGMLVVRTFWGTLCAQPCARNLPLNLPYL